MWYSIGLWQLPSLSSLFSTHTWCKKWPTRALHWNQLFSHRLAESDGPHFYACLFMLVLWAMEVQSIGSYHCHNGSHSHGFHMQFTWSICQSWWWKLHRFTDLNTFLLAPLWVYETIILLFIFSISKIVFFLVVQIFRRRFCYHITKYICNACSGISNGYHWKQYIQWQEKRKSSTHHLTWSCSKTTTFSSREHINRGK